MVFVDMINILWIPETNLAELMLWLCLKLKKHQSNDKVYQINTQISTLYIYKQNIKNWEHQKIQIRAGMGNYEFHRYIYNIVDMYLPPYLGTRGFGADFQYCNIAVLQTNIAILFLSIALLLQYFFKSSIGVLQYCKKLKSCNTAILLKNINFAKAINAKV